jgi:N-acetylneuraminic acid mutarotase
MSQARGGLGVVAVDGKIYAIGGVSGIDVIPNNNGGYYYKSNFVGTNEQYDPLTDTWTTLKSMPTPRAGFTTFVYQSKIYCIGGNTVGDFDIRVHEVYDTVSNVWSTKMSLPCDAGLTVAQVVDGKFFVMTFSRDLYMYDPDKDTWSQKTSMPYPDNVMPSWFPTDITELASTVVGNQIRVYFRYMYGYFEFDEKAMIYNTKTDQWSEGCEIREIDNYGATVTTSGRFAPQKVYVLTNNSTSVYDPKMGTWSSAKTMPTERAGFGVAIVDDILYVVGGSAWNGIWGETDVLESCSTTEQYIPIGYRDTLSSDTDISLSNTTIVIIVLTLGVGIIGGLVFYFKKKKRLNEIYTMNIQ